MLPVPEQLGLVSVIYFVIIITYLPPAIYSLHQYLNGWCQNIDPYTQVLGKYFNLNKCR